MSEIQDKIKNELSEAVERGELYVTIRTMAKKIECKQQEILDNLPSNVIFTPSKSGSLGEYRLSISPDVEEEEEDEDDLDSEYEKLNEEAQDEYDQDREEENKVSDEFVVEDEVAEEVPSNLAVKPEDQAIAAPAPETPAAELVVCVVCNSKVRATTDVIRGVCPLCWRELTHNVSSSTKALMAMSEEEFAAVIAEEKGRRQKLADYKTSRTLTKEEYEERKDNLLPVKDVFAAAKEAGYGPGRVAKAMGGDRFRHEPLGGFGSVWTPYFYGARNGWYFDKEILNHFEDLKKPDKPVKIAKERTPRKDSNGNPISRSGPRGKALKPVPATPAPVESAPDEVLA